MAYLDAADCAVRVKNRLNRPTSEQAYTRSTTDDVLYEMMTEANDHIVKRIATFIPDAMISAPVELVSTDSGKTYDFPDDADSNPAFLLGHFKLYENRESIPDYPLVEGVDYVIEGTKIRLPYNDTRTFTDGGPWVQSVAPGGVVNASTQPTCPVIARLAMIEETCARLAPRVGRDPQEFADAMEREWSTVLAAVRTQGFKKGGRLTVRRYPRFWHGR